MVEKCHVVRHDLPLSSCQSSSRCSESENFEISSTNRRGRSYLKAEWKKAHLLCEKSILFKVRIFSLHNF